MLSKVCQFSRFHVGGLTARTAMALAALAAVGAAGTAMATTYTYTPNNAVTDQWSAGTDWSSTPVSGAANTLTFVGNNSTVLADGLTNTNTDDISGAFQAADINLQGTGPTSGAATINIAAASGSSLDLVAPAAGSVVANLNADAGAAGLTYNVSAPVSLTANAAGNGVVFQGAGTATFNFSGGITTTNSAALSIQNSGSGAPTVTLSGSAASTVQGLAVLGGANLDANADLNVTGVNSGETIKGGFSVNSGVMTQGNNATVNVGTVGSTSSYVWDAFIGVGGPGNNGTYNLNSGTLNINVSNLYGGLRVGQSTGVAGTLNVNGGTLNNYVENASTPTADVLGTLGLAVGGSGTVNQDGGLVNTGQVAMVGGTSTNPSYPDTTAVYNLNGGTLATGNVNMHTTGTGDTATFNFNGGTLQANASSASFMQGLTTANVQAGGAVIDTNGKTITIAQNLLSDPAAPGGTDGGLTLLDSSTNHNGELILSGTGNTYNGNTSVQDGTLQINTGFLASTSTVSIATGAKMILDYSGTDSITSLILGGVVEGPGIYGYGHLGSSFFTSAGVTNGTLTIPAIPEPATLGLLALGGLGILASGRRQRRA